MEMRDPAADINNTAAITPNEAPETVAAQGPETETVEVTVEETAAVNTDTAVEAAETVAETAEAADTTGIAQLLAQARELDAKDAAEISGDELRRMRQHFNTALKAFNDALMNPEAEARPAVTPEDIDELKNLLDTLREKKAAHSLQLEQAKIENLARKISIIDQICAMAEGTDNINKTFSDYRTLVEEFNSIGEVPATEETTLWKRFSTAREQYSDNLKINKELRDYDFRKNLEAKEALIAEAEKLLELTDLVEANRRLGDLHVQWRALGPVDKELRDQIWEKFKHLSTEIRRRHQAHFEARKEEEQRNEEAKTALCEQLEAIDLETLKNQSAWEKTTDTVKAVQEQWKQLGFANRKANNTLYQRYRAWCDNFFERKARFYREAREAMAANLVRKRAIVEQAEALRDSTEWRKTADTLTALQQEWKTIGPVARKQSDELWQRFIAACDAFFDRKKKDGNERNSEQQNNLRAKIEIIEVIEAVPADAEREAVLEALKTNQQAWQQIGHVPFKEKDRVYDRYHAALDRLRNMLDQSHNRARMQRYENSVKDIQGDANKMGRERDRLLRAADAKRAEIRTYENNLGFLSAKSKSGDSMLKDFARRIDRLRGELDAILDKIKLLDSKA